MRTSSSPVNFNLIALMANPPNGLFLITHLESLPFQLQALNCFALVECGPANQSFSYKDSGNELLPHLLGGTALLAWSFPVLVACITEIVYWP